jgi:hypothetical protein
MADSLRDRCISRLKYDWPDTLHGWEERERNAMNKDGTYVPREIYPHPILAMELRMRLAQESFNDILPSAFYDLSRYGPSNIFNGAPAIPKVYGQDESKFIRLTSEVIQRVLYGRECGQRYVASFVERELRDRRESRRCEYRTLAPAVARRHCREAFHYTHLQLLRGVGGITHGRDADPLYTLSQAAEMIERQEFHHGEQRYRLRICGECKQEFVAVVKRSKEEVWRLIPTWFDPKPSESQSKDSEGLSCVAQ